MSCTNTLESGIPGTYPTREDLPVVVTVIEAGHLERQVCLLFESLRRWGGSLSSATCVAVNPRKGPEISTSSRQILRELRVDYQRITRDDPFIWFPYLNKTAAVKHVASQHKGTTIWFDADVLVLNDPKDLLLIQAGGPAHFAACASDKNIGTERDDDRFAPYFRKSCEVLTVEFSSLPYILTEECRTPIRLYWNSGVYAFAGSSGLHELHHDFTLALLREGIGSHESKLFFTDQLCLGLAVHKLNLKFKALTRDYNYSVGPRDAAKRISAAGNQIRILHYHDSLWPASFEALCSGLSSDYLELADWLRKKGYLTNAMPVGPRLYGRFLSSLRSYRETEALKRVKLY